MSTKVRVYPSAKSNILASRNSYGRNYNRSSRFVMASTGSGAEFEAYLENVLSNGIESSSNVLSSAQMIGGSQLESISNDLSRYLGSKAGLNAAITVNIGDSSYGFIYESSEDGELYLVNDTGDQLAVGHQDILDFILRAYDVTPEVLSATNTSGLASQSVMGNDSSEITMDYMQQVADHIELYLATDFPIEDVEVSVDSSGISIIKTLDEDGNFDEGRIEMYELMGGDAEGEAFNFAQEFYAQYPEINSSTDVSAANASAASDKEDPEFLEIYSELLNTLNDMGYDTNTEEVASVCYEGAQDIVNPGGDSYPVEDWLNNSKDILEGLPRK